MNNVIPSKDNKTRLVMGNTSSLNIPLTDELKRFIVNQSGNGTLYSTPSEYVRDLIRHERNRKEASELRSTIIEGYLDAIHERTIEFSGNLKADLAAFQKSNTQWLTLGLPIVHYKIYNFK